jgi:RHS repeat-associated protein
MRTTRIMIVLAASVFSFEARAAEICGNGIDDDADDYTDEGCYPTLTTGRCESPLSCADAGMVSPSTGTLHYSLDPDISPRVPYGPGIGFRRFYLSQYAPGGGAPAYRTSLGPRWGHTYATWIDALESPTRAVLHTAQGQDVLLNKTSSDATWEYFTPRPGHHFKEFKRRLASPNDYEIETLTGESMKYDENGRLKEVRDSLATPNIVTLEYDGNAQVARVIDASAKRQLLFGYTSGVMTSMKFQIFLSGSWVDQHTTTFGYTSGNLTSVTIGGQLAQTNVYTSNYLTSIQDGGGKTLVNFVYDGTTAGKTVRVDTPRGVVGYEFAPSRTECTGANKTVLYFHKANTSSCNVDSDCGTGHLCGGKTGTGSTGQCFRGARCLVVSSPSEDVITGVSAFAGNSQACEGACLDAIDHVWKTVGDTLDLGAVKDPSSKYTSMDFNANGMPTRITYGDVDSATGGGTREVFLFYGDSNVPGKVTETRRKSELDVNAALCSGSVTFGCARTLSSYNSDGLLSSTQLIGTTLDASASNLAFTYTTGYSYNAKGQLTQIDGPLAGSNDVTVFEYWSAPSDPLKDGFLQNYKRKKDATNYLTQSSLSYDLWGNATSVSDVDGTISCQTFDTARNFLTQRREQMAGQTDCTSNAADLVTSYARDSALRLTQLTLPDGSCLIYESDSRGRLSKTKRRDDCNAVSTGDTQELTYSDEGLVTKTELKDAAGTVKKRQELTYFDSRRLEKMINPVNTAKWTGITWDVRGLIDTVAAVDGATDLSKTHWTYNAEGRVATENRHTAGSAYDTWTLLFDWLGNQADVQGEDKKSTTSTRDDLGRRVKLLGADFGGPTLHVFDAASRVGTITEAYGTNSAVTHSFTFDNLARQLVADYAGTCMTVNNPDITRVYDSLSGAPSCPGGTSCTNLGGRLAYVKVKLMCQTSLADKTLEQETWYGYDAAGRLTHEYISDDNGRTAAHVYAWTKNGALQQTTLPSTVVLGATFDSVAGNSDKDRVTALWRTNTSTPIIDSVLYEPFGPVQQYNQQNSPGTGLLRTRIARNLAYRQTLNIVEKTDGTNIQSSVTVAEDMKGRTTSRDYYPSDPTIAGRYDSFYQYDQQDRVLCESTASGTCPTSGATLKNNHSASPPFTTAGDWKTLLHKIPGSTGVSNVIGLYPTTHFVYTVAQTLGTPALGTTNYGGDRFARIADDNFSTLTHDRREFTYDGRQNLANVRGEYKPGASWNFYDVASAFDAKNRRVFKSFYNETTLKTATWFFYYDALDRLTEVKYTPDTSAAATYSMFQLVWLGDKLVAYWQTDYPSVTTSKRYVSTDEMNRPVDMMSWPASGVAIRVWTINPDAWGNDTVLVGSSVFQPILFAGQYKDDETLAWQNDGTTKHRPGVVLNGFRTYDPWTGSYLQVDPLVDSTWSSFTYVNGNPVGMIDRDGRLMISISVAFGDSFWGTGYVGCFSSNSTEEVSGCLAGFIDPGRPPAPRPIPRRPPFCESNPNDPQCSQYTPDCQICVDGCDIEFEIQYCNCVSGGMTAPQCAESENSNRRDCILKCITNGQCSYNSIDTNNDLADQNAPTCEVAKPLGFTSQMDALRR